MNKGLPQQQQENREKWYLTDDYTSAHLDLLDTLTASTWKAAQEDAVKKFIEWCKKDVQATSKTAQEPMLSLILELPPLLDGWYAEYKPALEELSERKV